MMIQSNYDGHRAPGEPIGRSTHQEDDTVESSTSHRQTSGDVLNHQDASESKVKENLRGKKEGPRVEEPEYTEKRTSDYEGKTNAQSQTSSVPVPLSSSDLIQSLPVPSPAANIADDILSNKSFASSIKRSFNMLNSVDLSTNKVREPSGSFLFGAGMYPRNQNNNQEEIDCLVDFANCIIRRKENK